MAAPPAPEERGTPTAGGAGRDEPGPPTRAASARREPGVIAKATVPYRVILATIAMVLATFVAFQLLIALQRILTWLIIAGFFAVVLNPAVEIGVQRLHLRRTVAAMLVFFIGLVSLSGLLYVFIRPIINESSHFADDLPRFVDDAKAGRGSVGQVVQRYHIDRWVDQNQARLKKALQNSGNKALDVAKKVGTTAAAIGTILVLTFLILVEGPRMLASGLGMLGPPRQERLSQIGRDAARAVTSYMAGNLLISVIAGVVTYTGLWVFGVPFRTVMAVWVGFADLVPLIGATLGAVPTVAIAFLHSTTAGIGMIVMYVVYQQFENHVLQVGIMARTVRLSPLVVLVSLLAGVQLSGLLGAMLAIPAAGIIQVVAKDIYHDRQRLKADRLEALGDDVAESLPGAEAMQIQVAGPSESPPEPDLPTPATPGPLVAATPGPPVAATPGPPVAATPGPPVADQSNLRAPAPLGPPESERTSPDPAATGEVLEADPAVETAVVAPSRAHP